MTTLSPSWLALAVPKIEAVCSSEKSSSCSVPRETQTYKHQALVAGYHYFTILKIIPFWEGKGSIPYPVVAVKHHSTRFGSDCMSA